MNGALFFLYKLAGGALTPPGCFFVAYFLLLFRLFLRSRERKARRIAFCFFVWGGILYALFMPLTATALMGFLEMERPDLRDDGLPTLVAVLAGGGTHPVPGAPRGTIELAEQSYQRLAEGVKVARRFGWPLVYSGSYDEGDDVEAYRNSIRESVRQWGLESEVLLDTASRTTWENMREISKIVEEGQFKRVVVSTTAYHMKRSLWMAQQQMPSETLVVPWPSGWRSSSDTVTFNDFVPSARAFYDSCTALREIAGLAAYRLMR